MHFRSDEKFLELTKILEIKNKGNYRGSVPIFHRPKWHFSKIFLVFVFWNTLVQVGVNCKESLIQTIVCKLPWIEGKNYAFDV